MPYNWSRRWLVRTALKKRLEARISAEQKGLLVEAARLRGQSLSDFVIGSAQEAARKTVQDYQVVTLSRRDQDVFIQALLEAPAPNRALRKAAERHREGTAG
jgi:uncharacterized protein (DUF1778 family)